MHYYISRCWRSTKLAVATTQTVASGGMLIYGLLAAGGAFSVVVGIIGLACSALLFFDSSKVQNDIVKAIEQNEKSLREYRKENGKYASENVKLHKNVALLDESLQKSASEIFSLQKLRSQYCESLTKFENQLTNEKQQIEKLEDQVGELERLRGEFFIENQSLQQTLLVAKRHSEEIEQLYEQTAESDAAHKAQVDRLKTIVASMQELLAVVANQGDEFQQFSEAIDTRLIEMDQQNASLENTANMMDALLKKMTKQRFEQLDTNKDGVIDQTEFEQQLDNKSEE